MIDNRIPTPPPLPDFYRNPRGDADNSRELEEQEFYTMWHLEDVTRDVQKWVRKAQNKNVNVDKQIEKLTRIILDAPSIRDPETGQIREVTLVQQIIVRGMYCNQVIRLLALDYIHRKADEGKKMAALQAKHHLIDTCKKWLLNQVPSEIFLKPPKIMEDRYRFIKHKVNDMTLKLLNNNSHI